METRNLSKPTIIGHMNKVFVDATLGIPARISINLCNCLGCHKNT